MSKIFWILFLVTTNCGMQEIVDSKQEKKTGQWLWISSISTQCSVILLHVGVKIRPSSRTQYILLILFVYKLWSTISPIFMQWSVILFHAGGKTGHQGSARRSVVSTLGCQPSSPGSIPRRTESVTITLSRHLCASPHVGHTRRIRPVLKYRITNLEA